MGKLSYVIKRARKMDYRAMLKTADMLHKKTGKSRIWLMADMAKCAAKYTTRSAPRRSRAAFPTTSSRG